MTVDYLLYQPSAEIQATADWMERLLPESWLKSIPSHTQPQRRLHFLLGRTLLYRRLGLLGYSYVDLPSMYYTTLGKPFFFSSSPHSKKNTNLD